MRFQNIPTFSAWKSASSSFLERRSSKPKLVRIDKLIEKYHHVFDMSKLNILMELREAIIDWTADKLDREVGTGRLPAMRALEEIVVRKLYELDGWGRHRYLKAVCIGYEIRTGHYNPDKIPTSTKKRDQIETTEMGGRCTKLRKAISTAHVNYELYKNINAISDDEDDKTMKIFMAPEFFFRGPYGAYRDIGKNAAILEAMRGETEKEQYADWLFIHGTALFATEKEGGGTFLENYALVQRGGPRRNSHHDFVVGKEFPSHVDFEHPTIGDLEWFDPGTSEARVAGVDVHNIMPEGGRADPVQRTLNNNEQQVSELVGGSIFTMDGILFGLEVCRDHYLGRLSHSMENGRVLIQLIPSAGMDIKDVSIACVPDGIIFNVDGNAPHAHVQVRTAGVVPAEVDDTVVGTGRIKIFEPLRIPWPGLVRRDVAARLNMSRRVLSGKTPIAPPPLRRR